MTRSHCETKPRKRVARGNAFSKLSISSALEHLKPRRGNGLVQRLWVIVPVLATVLPGCGNAVQPTAAVPKTIIRSRHPSEIPKVIVLPRIPYGDGNLTPSAISASGGYVVGFGAGIPYDNGGARLQTFLWSEGKGHTEIPFPDESSSACTPDAVSDDGDEIVGGCAVGSAYEFGTVYSEKDGYVPLPAGVQDIVIGFGGETRTYLGSGIVGETRRPIQVNGSEISELASMPASYTMGSTLEASADGGTVLVELNAYIPQDESAEKRQPASERAILRVGAEPLYLSQLFPEQEIGEAGLSRNGAFLYGTHTKDDSTFLFARNLRTGTMESIAVPADWAEVRASCISDDGLIVFGGRAKGQGRRAFIWRIGIALEDFEEYASRRGLRILGWSVSEIVDCAANGETFVATGVRRETRRPLWIKLPR